MTSGELVYLVMVVAGAAVFAATLIYANWVAPGNRLHPGE